MCLRLIVDMSRHKVLVFRGGTTLSIGRNKRDVNVMCGAL